MSGNQDLSYRQRIGQYLPSERETVLKQDNHGYWKANLRILGALLSIWFIVSFGFGILLVEELNQIPFFGFKLGFWWAQQGAIYVFVALIFVYIHLMQKLDRKYGVSDEDDSSEEQS